MAADENGAILTADKTGWHGWERKIRIPNSDANGNGLRRQERRIFTEGREVNEGLGRRLGKGTTSPRPSPPHCPAAEREKRRPPSIMECHRLGERAEESEKAPPHPGPLPRTALRRRGRSVGRLRSWSVIDSASALKSRKRHHLTPALSPALPCGGEGEASAAFDHGVSSTRRAR